MDNRRLILLLVFSFSLVMLWDAWQKQALPPSVPATANAADGTKGQNGALPTPTAAAVGAAAVPVATAEAAKSSTPNLKVVTDLFIAEISAKGGDLVRLELIRHPDTDDKTKGFVLFSETGKNVYLAQSGAIGEGLPNHKTAWIFAGTEQALKPGSDELAVRLTPAVKGSGEVVKTYIFRRNSYQIEVRYEGLPVGGFAYYQITRDGKPAESPGGGMMMGVSTFTGPAVYTDAEKYQKLEFSDIAKGKAKFATKANNGWLAMVQHYFVSAWLPAAGVEREFYVRKVADDLYSAGVIVPVATDGKSSVTLYAGPQLQSQLEKIAPGLDLVVDYGWLTVIAAPLFWVLGAIHSLLGNWGWAIIGLTVLIKLAFFPLSAASYKSMAKMRVLTPKLTKLKETFGDDKQRLNQAMMEMYKKEKVNPLGGCLPVLIQIPVFIALYWVLLGTVEMRNAPWLGWITDLSVKDPYYVLPLIMGVTMLVQTRLNPAPADPIQAKIMWMMPIVFTGMFLFFPSGLVLYWVVNNLLSIGQQWQITRMIEGSAKK
ncbi:MAG: membrane protein insertase YidC [Rhodocyclaceae bacterium]|nr:membrane protein insertase YidC [Rhodocyclaceae bacterium]MBK9624701.1 membrane protein insertase YidC [Rhodocyclaceae bacterium]MBL0077059.1 membrane protein insertase YidC [Rhodocyclaceae bacterium]MBP6109516.1 membrane protein insertase YidC [Rhodocyclaceae bacterium]MBP6279290.1 membrane protein insertase YidC [Rhodocyclaceae bacterium]